MTFAEPQYLWLILALPLLAAASWWSAHRRQRALARFAGGREFAARFRSEVSPHRRAAKVLLVQAALLAAIVTAARPQWGVRLEEVTRGGIDLAIVLDTSLSMAAEDVAPSRLDLARHGVDTLVKRLEGDRVALISFAGQASVNCPLTLDHAAVRLFLDSLDVEAVPVAGTSLADALRVALRALGENLQPGESRSRGIILLTDGEDHEGGLEEIAPELEEAGIRVYGIGVGTTRGAPIPVRDGAGNPAGYKTDGEGKVVTTRLDEAALEQLALATGGRYYRATASQLELEEIVRSLSSLEQQEFGAVLRARYEERFQIPLALALLALLLEGTFGDRVRRTEPTRPSEGSP